MSLGWAIVSTGRHPDLKMAPAINAVEDAQIRAIVSRDLERAEEFAVKHGAQAAYGDFESMLRDPSVDVVYLASPNSLHCNQAVRAAQAGKHVLCEKPMALTIEDCQLMIETCVKHGVRLGVGFHLRHHKGHRYMRDLVSENALGTIALVQAQWAYGNRGLERPNPRLGLQHWWEEPSLVGAGTWMGTGVHCVDLLRYILGEEVEEVSAITDASVGNPLEHLATVLLRFQNGTIATVVASRKLPDSHNNLTIYGSEGRAEIEDSLSVDLRGKLTVKTDKIETLENYDTDSLAMYIRQVEMFNKAVMNEEKPVASGWDGLKVAEVTSAMIESVKTGRKVRI